MPIINDRLQLVNSSPKVVTKNREDSYLSSIKMEIDEFSSELEKEMRDWLEKWETRDTERSNSNVNRHRSA